MPRHDTHIPLNILIHSHGSWTCSLPLPFIQELLHCLRRQQETRVSSYTHCFPYLYSCCREEWQLTANKQTNKQTSQPVSHSTQWPQIKVQFKSLITFYSGHILENELLLSSDLIFKFCWDLRFSRRWRWQCFLLGCNAVWTRRYILSRSSGLKFETVCFFEALVSTFESIRRHISEEQHRHSSLYS
jgi:hypothetical protein